MCLRPLRILNNSNHYSPNDDALYLKVPCGHCEECANSLRTDWFVRCFYEYQNTKANCTHYYTLTFNDDNVPRYNENILCFSRPMVQKFLKRLRKSLAELGVSLRYMIVSEFGETTLRPHHHALFFLSKYLNPFVFKKLVADAWHYGFVYAGKLNNGIVCNSTGIQYVTKYVTKDFSFTDRFLTTIAQSVIYRYRNVLRLFNLVHGSLFVTCDEYGSIHAKYSSLVEKSSYASVLAKYIVVRIKREIRKYLPFHLQSTKLGLSMIDSDKIDFLNESITYMEKSGSPVSLPLPRYIKRKLWYESYPNEKDGKKNLFRLNDAGKLHYKDVLIERIKKRSFDYSTYLQNLSLLDDDAPIFISQLCDTKFKSIEEIDMFLSESSYTSHELAVYDVIFRGRVCPFKFSDIDYTSVIDSAFDYAESCIDRLQEIDLSKLHEHSQKFINMLDMHLWDKSPQFELMERYLQVLDAFTLYIKSRVSDARLARDKLAKKTRDHFKYV